MSRPGGFSRNLFAAKNLTRSRWAAIGAAVAVTLGGGGLIGVSAAETSSTLTPVSPVRVVDTRPTGKVGNIADGASITVQITGAIKTVNEGTKTVVPEGSSAIIGNLTLVETHANDYGGFATVYPCGDRPEASNVNFTSGQTIANSVAVPLSTTGTVCIYVYGTAHVLFDISGYYTTNEISEVAASVVSLANDLASVETDIDSVEAEVDAVETEVDAVETDIDAVEAEVDAVETDIDSVEAEVDAVEEAVDDVADDVGRLTSAQFLPSLRDASNRPFFDIRDHDDWDWPNYQFSDPSGLFGAPIESGRFSENATVELRVAAQIFEGEFTMCFAIGSTLDGLLEESEVCIDSNTAPTADGIVLTASPRVPLPASGILNPHLKLKSSSDASCRSSWSVFEAPACTGILEWFGFYVYD